MEGQLFKKICEILNKIEPKPLLISYVSLWGVSKDEFDRSFFKNWPLDQHTSETVPFKN
jgi:hypothetical protein